MINEFLLPDYNGFSNFRWIFRVADLSDLLVKGVAIPLSDFFFAKTVVKLFEGRAFFKAIVLRKMVESPVLPDCALLSPSPHLAR